MRVTVPSPWSSGCPSDSSSVKRTRVPGGCDDLVKMKMRSSLRNREYLVTKVVEVGAADDDPQHDHRLQCRVVGVHERRRSYQLLALGYEPLAPT